MTAPQTVRDLRWTLAQCNQDAIVTLGKAPGPLAYVTETLNGFVILDCGPPLSPDVVLRLGGRAPGLYVDGEHVP